MNIYRIFSLYIREMHIKNRMRYHVNLLEQQQLKRLTPSNIGKDVEKMKPIPFGENAKWYNHFRK